VILLDTNVISELVRPVPDRRVIAWFDGLGATPLALCAITVAELRYGLACLPAGRRRAALETAVTAMLTQEFADRILPFGAAAAEAYGELAARHRQAGRTVGQSDLMIAAIALAEGCRLATRNGRDFALTGVEVIDPFAGAA
jgi:predicted nucleic acid-binding protein